MLVTTDNNQVDLEANDEHRENLRLIAGRNICDISLDDSPNLLIFPHSFEHYGDRIDKESIFSLHENRLTTGNIMGFVGVNGTELRIRSRFAEKDDFFLYYMLQKVFSINLFDLKHSIERDNIMDFLMYLFPHFLKKALRQGLFKEYKRRDYNDANVRGSIDVNRHLKQNIPFAGNVAYYTKEHCYDNRITQLIRHTIEFIRTHPSGRNILYSDAEMQNHVTQVTFATPSYNRNIRHSILAANIRLVSHPYFFEYIALQKICVQILRQEGLRYGRKNDNKVYGLLFDGAWLWEEYLYTVLSNFKHPRNRTGEGRICLFTNGKGERYPDFLKDGIVLDAKYKRLAGKDVGSLDRNDLNQIISYMHVLNASLGGFICPSDGEAKSECRNLGTLKELGGEVKLWSVQIPKNVESFATFSQEMDSSISILRNISN